MPQKPGSCCLALEFPDPPGQLLLRVGWIGHEGLGRDFDDNQIEPTSAQIGKGIDGALIQQRAQTDDEGLGR